MDSRFPPPLFSPFPSQPPLPYSPLALFFFLPPLRARHLFSLFPFSTSLHRFIPPTPRLSYCVSRCNNATSVTAANFIRDSEPDNYISAAGSRYVSTSKIRYPFLLGINSVFGRMMDRNISVTLIHYGSYVFVVFFILQ